MSAHIFFSRDMLRRFTPDRIAGRQTLRKCFKPEKRRENMAQIGLKETLSLLAAGYKKKDIEALAAIDDQKTEYGAWSLCV